MAAKDITFSSEKENKLKIAMGELLGLADSLDVKKVISTYNFKKTYSSNIEKLKTLSGNQLEECADFLKLSVRKENNVKAYKNKEVLADWIIMKIESHFEAQCDECGETYRNKLNDTEPYLRCFLCMQGCHDCEDISARFESSSQQTSGQLTGTVWLCKGCRVKNNIFCVTKIPNLAVTFDSATSETIEKSDGDVEAKTAKDDKPSPRRELGGDPNEELDVKGNEDKDHTDKDHSSKKPDICPLYKKRQCPHGPSGQIEVEGKICPLPHPKKCLKYCRFGKRKGGCTKGGSCTYYHPVLCKYSVKANRCSNTECTFTHLKGTKRPRNEDIDKRTSNARKEHERERKPFRWRKDSAASNGSRASECYRTPSYNKRERKESERQKVAPAPSSDAFLEKLMENMKRGFDQQKVEIGLMKQGLDQQIEALWKQVGSISQTSLPQLPPFVHQQLPPHMIPTQNQAPWNIAPNQCSMF